MQLVWERKSRARQTLVFVPRSGSLHEGDFMRTSERARYDSPASSGQSAEFEPKLVTSLQKSTDITPGAPRKRHALRDGVLRHGVAMGSYLGARIGAMIASDEGPLRRLQEFRFKGFFYRGRPWFLPFVGSWYRVSTRSNQRQINDDPNSFRLPSDLLSIFDQPYEVSSDVMSTNRQNTEPHLL
jgi:hypothetical protein